LFSGSWRGLPFDRLNIDDVDNDGMTTMMIIGSSFMLSSKSRDIFDFEQGKNKDLFGSVSLFEGKKQICG
jgi:hypothetical protein